MSNGMSAADAIQHMAAASGKTLTAVEALSGVPRGMLCRVVHGGLHGFSSEWLAKVAEACGYELVLRKRSGKYDAFPIDPER